MKSRGYNFFIVGVVALLLSTASLISTKTFITELTKVNSGNTHNMNVEVVAYPYSVRGSRSKHCHVTTSQAYEEQVLISKSAKELIKSLTA